MGRPAARPPQAPPNRARSAVVPRQRAIFDVVADHASLMDARPGYAKAITGHIFHRVGGDRSVIQIRNIGEAYPNPPVATFADVARDFTVMSQVISGNRPLTLMKSQDVRYAAYDGRLTELNSDAPANLIPLISDRWGRHFTWRGHGHDLVTCLFCSINRILN